MSESESKVGPCAERVNHIQHPSQNLFDKVNFLQLHYSISNIEMIHQHHFQLPST